MTSRKLKRRVCPGALGCQGVERSRLEKKNQKSLTFGLLDDERYEISKKRVRAPETALTWGL